MEEFQEKYGGATSVQDIRSDARKVDKYYISLIGIHYFILLITEIRRIL